MGSGWGSQPGNGGVLQQSLCWASAMDQEGYRPIMVKARSGTEPVCSDISVVVASGCWLGTLQPHGTGCPSWSLAPKGGAGISRCSIMMRLSFSKGNQVQQLVTTPTYFLASQLLFGLLDADGHKPVLPQA